MRDEHAGEQELLTRMGIIHPVTGLDACGTGAPMGLRHFDTVSATVGIRGFTKNSPMSTINSSLPIYKSW
jgi:hypothetical protein